MHCLPFSIRDSFDCCHMSWTQITSRVLPHPSRMNFNSAPNPLCTTVTSFRAPTCPPRSHEHLAGPTIPDPTKIRIHPIGVAYQTIHNAGHSDPESAISGSDSRCPVTHVGATTAVWQSRILFDPGQIVSDYPPTWRPSSCNGHAVRAGQRAQSA